MIGELYYLTEDVFSNFKGFQYGKIGDRVSVVSIHGEVLIVENSDGLRFSVLGKFLSQELLHKYGLNRESELQENISHDQVTASNRTRIQKHTSKAIAKETPGQISLF